MNWEVRLKSKHMTLVVSYLQNQYLNPLFTCLLYLWITAVDPLFSSHTFCLKPNRDKATITYLNQLVTADIILHFLQL